jgi:hypothetical protein
MIAKQEVVEATSKKLAQQEAQVSHYIQPCRLDGWTSLCMLFKLLLLWNVKPHTIVLYIVPFTRVHSTVW